MKVDLSPSEIALIQNAMADYQETPKLMHQTAVFASQVLASNPEVFEHRLVQASLKEKEAQAHFKSNERRTRCDAIRSKFVQVVERRAA
jgi:hypothetical protein